MVALLAGALLGVVEALADLPLELRQDAALEHARGDVDLDVELAELGHEVRVGDALEHPEVRERRVAGLVGEVELDLEADRAAVGVEARLGEHPREDVEAAAHLLAITLAVLAAEDLRFDLLAHEARSLPVIGPTYAKKVAQAVGNVR